MKMQEFQSQINAKLKELFPDLTIGVMSDRSRMTIQCCAIWLDYKFYIDKSEWEMINEKNQERLLKHRLLDTMYGLRELVNKTIVQCGGKV